MCLKRSTSKPFRRWSMVPKSTHQLQPIVHDTAAAGLTVFWHHGSPQTGLPPDPLLDTPGIRWVGYDRPAYGGSTRLPGRNAASAAADVAAIADALGIERFAVLGSSGGGAPALGCAPLLPDRVIAAASMSGLAP